MPFWEDTSFFTAHLSRRTSIFGLRLWMVVGICFGASISLLLLFLLSLCLTLRLRRRRRRVPLPSPSPSSLSSHSSRKPLRLHLLDPTPPISKEIVAFVPQIQLSVAKTDSRGAAEEALHLGWGRRYALRELEDATGDFAGENVIGEGGYGIVYRGLLAGVTAVAVKQLLNSRGQAEKEFMAEVEAIGRVRHKNLVRLLGYCIEESHRILVYEYVDNGNLDQWLHGDVSPLSWDIRMSIILGTAKGLAYLHEGLEPKVIHRDVKSSNILVDKQWNSKISDFGLAKLLCSQRSYVTTRVMGTFGYVAPEYASTGMLNERSDVYSFGVLIMEIISGRTPVDYSRPPGEVNMVEWLKNMVGEGRCEEVVDPKILQKPSSRTLKTVLLVALRCVDPDALKRPKMGHVIHMLEMEGLLFHEGLKHERYAYAEALLHRQ